VIASTLRTVRLAQKSVTSTQFAQCGAQSASACVEPIGVANGV